MPSDSIPARVSDSPGSAAPMALHPQLADLQGLLVQRFPQTHFGVLLFSIRDVDAARGFIARWLPMVVRGDVPANALRGTLLSFAFGWGGLKALLADDPSLDPELGAAALDFGFTDQGPDHRAVADQLGFVGASAAATWWDGCFESSAIDLVVYAAFESEDDKQAFLGEIRQSAVQSGLAELELTSFADRALSGYRPPGGILHFGYRDGISSLNVSWDGQDPGAVDFREFVLGYSNENYPQSPRAGPWADFVRDGSFACISWIHQDVAAFRRFLDDNAALAPDGAEPATEWVAAKLMGRWPKGYALVHHPLSQPAGGEPGDAFDYTADPDGKSCPLTAHIRVVHPRSDRLTYANRRRFPAGPPRLLRRGFSFGPDLEGNSDDGVPRGVVGTFLCARVNEQFYTVLRWMQRTSFTDAHFALPQTERMQDGLIGNRAKPDADTRLVLGSGGNAETLGLADFIRYRGVALAFLPSIPSLRRLSRPAG